MTTCSVPYTELENPCGSLQQSSTYLTFTCIIRPANFVLSHSPNAVVRFHYWMIMSLVVYHDLVASYRIGSRKFCLVGLTERCVSASRAHTKTFIGHAHYITTIYHWAVAWLNLWYCCASSVAIRVRGVPGIAYVPCGCGCCPQHLWGPVATPETTPLPPNPALSYEYETKLVWRSQPLEEVWEHVISCKTARTW